jgi:hypothetical protein
VNRKKLALSPGDRPSPRFRFPSGSQPYYIHLLETIMIYAIVLFGSTSWSATPARCRSAMPGCSASAPTPPACSSRSSARPLLVTLTAAIA